MMVCEECVRKAEADEAKKSAMTCTGCKQPIVAPPGGKINYKSNKFGDFHPECIKCAECRVPVDRFYEDAGRMLCRDCALPKCRKCGEAAESSVKASMGVFHPDCFRCENCNDKLSSHYNVNNLAVCGPCSAIENLRQNFKLLNYK
eukprot:Platyproteum_vivax@DN4667_c0_g1_i2.p1